MKRKFMTAYEIREFIKYTALTKALTVDELTELCGQTKTEVKQAVKALVSKGDIFNINDGSRGLAKYKSVISPKTKNGNEAWKETFTVYTPPKPLPVRPGSLDAFKIPHFVDGSRIERSVPILNSTNVNRVRND